MREGFGPPFYLELTMEDEDGITILYDVYKNDKKVGQFKVLSLGVAQIKRTCEMYNFPIESYKIKRISDGQVVWDGSVVGHSTGHVSID